MPPEKLAIIHPMRSGGTWLREQLAASTGLPLLCSWRAGLNRDWLRGELLDKLRAPRGIVHNHLVNWDRELAAIARERGWLTVMVARDPVSQCRSLYGFLRDFFLCDGVSIDEFFRAQARGEFCWIDHHHWAVPEWWREVDVIVPYAEPPLLYAELLGRIGLPPGKALEPRNQGGAHVEPRAEAQQEMVRSPFYARYLAALLDRGPVRRR